MRKLLFFINLGLILYVSFPRKDYDKIENRAWYCYGTHKCGNVVFDPTFPRVVFQVSASAAPGLLHAPDIRASAIITLLSAGPAALSVCRYQRQHICQDKLSGIAVKNRHLLLTRKGLSEDLTSVFSVISYHTTYYVCILYIYIKEYASNQSRIQWPIGLRD